MLYRVLPQATFAFLLCLHWGREKGRLSSSLVTPPPGLLLLGCYCPLARTPGSLLSWFSCFPRRQDSEPVEVMQGQEEANTSQCVGS